MSIEVAGNNSFENVPLLDMEHDVLAEGRGRFDPLLQDLARTGLSALCHGIEQSPASSALGTLTFGELFDGSNRFVNDALARKVDDGRYPQAPHADCFNAGIHITRAALAASSLFWKQHTIEDDYTQDGVYNVQRRVVLPIADDKASHAGMVINTYPVQNIQARILTRRSQGNDSRLHTRLDFAAALNGPGMLPWSTAVSVGVYLNLRRNVTTARLTSGGREGDFVRGSNYTDFCDLGRYASVVYENL